MENTGVGIFPLFQWFSWKNTEIFLGKVFCWENTEFSRTSLFQKLMYFNSSKHFISIFDLLNTGIVKSLFLLGFVKSLQLVAVQQRHA